MVRGERGVVRERREDEEGTARRAARGARGGKTRRGPRVVKGGRERERREKHEQRGGRGGAATPSCSVLISGTQCRSVAATRRSAIGNEPVDVDWYVDGMESPRPGHVQRRARAT